MENLFYSNLWYIKFAWIFLLIAGFSSTTFGTTFTVTKIVDTNDGICDADCSLREAVAAANMASTDDIINFDLTTFTIPQTITLGGNELTIANSGSLTINGIEANILTISGNNASRVFFINNEAKVTINNIVVSNGNGAGAYPNGYGGGILNRGILTFNNSTITNNSAAVFSEGGGISSNGGIVTINNSIISDNKAVGGGGIYSDGSSTINLTNSTVTRNLAQNCAGISIVFATLNLVNVTVAFNSANGSCGGINNSSGTVNSRNSIIARNSAVSRPDFSGTFTSQGYNLIGDTTGATITGVTTGNLLNVNPRLDPILRNNGGNIKTYSLRLGSPAIDAADPNIFPMNDQRGLPRPTDGDTNGTVLPDIGAFERQTNDVIRTSVSFDFDDDGMSDVSVYRPSNGVWYLNRSTQGFSGVQFGASQDLIVPADYDGDGKTDITVYRSGTWYLQRSRLGFAGIQFGLSTDVPAPADFNGDGQAELAVYRPSNGTWYVLNLVNNAFNAVQFGISTDKPVVADYDGDGKADYAVYRPENGVWYLLQSTRGFAAVQFGISTDKPVVGDYDGDGKADISVFRPSNGIWYLLNSTSGFTSVQFGVAEDKPTPADYDGDGKTDISVFRPSNGTWYQLRSTSGFFAQQFGISEDLPTPNVFVR